ncbi:MAG: hypothetical protein AABO41_13785 [Acidobacteriota bacterium]
MRIRTVILGLGVVIAGGLMCEASAQAVAQNANKPAMKKAKPAAKPNPTMAAPAAPAAGQTMTAAKPKAKPKRKASTAMAGVPMGVPACLKHLSKMAEKDPLIDYDGHPSEIINGGLLWNDPKSRCSIASDEAMKKKVIELAGAWRVKDGAKVRSLLEELAGTK